jgi:hypothetical protein
MLVVLKKQYTFSVTIKEGDLSDEFWEAIRHSSGADMVLEEVRDCLAVRGFDEQSGCYVRLTRFEEVP